jgi:tetratricopeptide (TPR) repeat protein
LSFTAAVSVNASPKAFHRRLLDVGAYTSQSHATGASIHYRVTALVENSEALTDSLERSIASGTIGRDSELAWKMMRLSERYASQSRYPDAVRWAEYAVRFDTSSLRCAQNLVSLDLALGRFDEAASVVTGMVPKIQREDAAAMHALSEVMQRLSEHYLQIANDSLAIEWAHRSFESEPKNLDRAYNLANCYMSTGHEKLALQTFEEIPDDSLSGDALTDIAIAEYSLFGADSALPYVKKAKDRSPTDAGIDSLLKLLLLKKRLNRINFR